jgi:hypothetical protein
MDHILRCAFIGSRQATSGFISQLEIKNKPPKVKEVMNWAIP